MQASSAQRREFFRLHFNAPLQFAVSRSPSSKAVSKNISSSGILFQTQTAPPQLSSIVWMNVDIRTLKICREIEQRALIFNNGLLGRVVRVEEDPDKGAYDVGVCFLTQDQKNSREIQQILADLSKKTA
ncbi:MAG: PilZ domain-containing protein [Candidatus Omnitrophica bacterium]|nr:PilZ domain-containing protein [Candidatus Omnitrophota bacterium]